MLLWRERGQTRVPSLELQQKVELLAAKQWVVLLDQAVRAAQVEPRPARPRAGARPFDAGDDTQRRAEQAVALAHLVELSAARAGLEAAPWPPRRRKHSRCCETL